jgi:membrane associated rhomboid family serine protease
LVALWLISFAGNIPIGNTAHLGGLICGLVFGLYLRTKYKNKTKYISNYFS